MVQDLLRKAVFFGLLMVLCVSLRAQPALPQQSEIGWNQPFSAGLLFLSNNDYDSALYFFELAIKRSPRDPRPWFQAGFCLGKLGDSAGKFRYYKRAIRLDPKYADPHYSLGISYLLAGQHCDAIREYVTLKPLDKTLAERLSQLLELMSDDPEGNECNAGPATIRAGARGALALLVDPRATR